MSSKMTRAVVWLAGITAIAALVNVGVANAAGQATPKAAAPKAEQAVKPKAVKPTVTPAQQAVTSDGYHNATRLGGPRALIGAVKDLKQLKRYMARPSVRKDVQGALDAAGLSPAVKDQVLNILIAADPTQMIDGKFEVGQTKLWMGLKNKGKPDVLRNVRWAGARPFAVWTFDVDDGETLYHFTLPKPCGNLALASSERSPKAIAAENARKAEEARRAEEARKVVPPPPPPPLPPPPPGSVSCGLTASAVKAKGGWSVSIDGGSSQTGGSPAASLVVQILGPTGAPVSMEYQGKAATELSLAPPFQATVLLRKPVAGTYTVKAASTAADPKASRSNCEATFTIIAEDNVNFFVEGDFGKERRVRVSGLSKTTPAVDLFDGFCAPLFGFKAGADLRLAPGWSFAPSVGVALNTRDVGQSSLFAEAEINRWFGRKGFIGTGIGVWDFTHGDTVAPVWLLQAGRQVWKASGPKENELHFVVSGRLFLNKMDDIANNYQFWAGLRYIIR